MNTSIMKSYFLGNSVNNYIIALSALASGILLVLILKRLHNHNIKKIGDDKADFRDFLDRASGSIVFPVLYFLVLYMAVKQLSLPVRISTALTYLTTIFLTLQGIRLLLSVSVHFIKRAWSKGDKQTHILKTNSLITITRIVIWSGGIIFLLDNLGVNITAVVAGLGIGGVAVALAAQTILGDLFNYFVILFDKPFEEGDFIIIDDFLGVIEHIGIKTTRVRSLGGEQLIFSNSDLCSSRIKNYKRMEKRRVVFKLGVTYQTSHDKMRKATQIIKKIIEDIENATFDRAHFSGYGDFSLDIEVVYYVLTGDYNKYMDTQQEINLSIMQKFEKEGIEFAYPTQTLYVNKDGGK